MRVLVVDDATLFRKVVRDVLRDIPGVEVVGVAANGRIAMEKIAQLKPDLLTLDVEMPELDGLGVLRELRELESAPAAVMLSSLTDRGAVKTTEALELGAFDFVLKPNGKDLAENVRQLSSHLTPIINTFRASQEAPQGPLKSPGIVNPATATKAAGSLNRLAIKPVTLCEPPEVCLIGVSTGGPAALANLLPSISADFPLPIIIVQHMPAVFTRKLADSLDQHCPLKVQEIENGMSIRKGNVYIAPGEKQTKVVPGVPYPELLVTDDPPEKHCRPSVDYLFRHAADVYGGRALCTILTGMGNDGTEGCQQLKSLGAKVLAQDAQSSVVYGMPRSVAEAGLTDAIAPLSKIAELMESFAWGSAQCK